MKKYFVYSLMAAAFGVMMNSCGKNSATSEEGTTTAVESEATAQPEEKLFYTDDDVKSVTGITAFDVKLDGITGMSGENNAKGFSAELTPSERTADNFNQYNKELFDMLKCVAEDGKIYADDMTEKSEASQTDDLGVCVFTYLYKYNGSNVYVTVASSAGEDANHYSVTVSK